MRDAPMELLVDRDLQLIVRKNLPHRLVLIDQALIVRLRRSNLGRRCQQRVTKWNMYQNGMQTMNKLAA